MNIYTLPHRVNTLLKRYRRIEASLLTDLTKPEYRIITVQNEKEHQWVKTNITGSVLNWLSFVTYPKRLGGVSWGGPVQTTDSHLIKLEFTEIKEDKLPVTTTLKGRHLYVIRNQEAEHFILVQYRE